MIELITIKAGKDYFRFNEEKFTRCNMSKASVYPLSDLDKATILCQQLQKSNIDAKLMKLTITEESFKN